jgi:hypothetical protein
MKKFIALTIIFLFAFQLKAQITNNNTGTYQYAVLRSEKFFGNVGLDLYTNNNKHENLYKTLRLDTLKLSDDYIKDYTYILKGLNYMDKLGYELVTSSVARAEGVPLLREYILRKKITDK